MLRTIMFISTIVGAPGKGKIKLVPYSVHCLQLSNHILFAKDKKDSQDSWNDSFPDQHNFFREHI